MKVKIKRLRESEYDFFRSEVDTKVFPGYKMPFFPECALKAVDENNNVLGFTAWRPVRSEIGFTLFTFVYPAFRKQGIQNLLHDTKVKYIKKEGATIARGVVFKKYMRDWAVKRGYKLSQKFQQNDKMKGDLGYQQRIELDIETFLKEKK
jgi:predicted GNAT family acetyltransferase